MDNAMLRAGEYVIVRDADLADEYCARVERDQPNESRVNPLVRVRYILRYPIQHAILWPDVPNENAPLQCGELARLTYVRRCEAGEEARFTYEATFAQALGEALRTAATEAEREILQRHREGRFMKKRIEIRK